ncbi:hypothetical protein Tco_0032092 [Tanacetum coccineum]
MGLLPISHSSIHALLKSMECQERESKPARMVIIDESITTLQSPFGDYALETASRILQHGSTKKCTLLVPESKKWRDADECGNAIR